MRKKIEKAATRYVGLIKRVGIEVIQPFKENPPIDREVKDPATVRQEKPSDDNRICATELFSLFTADIIKERVLFTR